ncbi:hypothetical protein ABZW30_44940 [Kitasatospora sp. NPDC004669]|uniref:hypothetical protein n=1 Tax=Kitasatospora sp. NPDC004669 TaxID=3154555 RepID=UPI0033BB2B00
MSTLRPPADGLAARDLDRHLINRAGVPARVPADEEAFTTGLARQPDFDYGRADSATRTS